MRKPKFKLCLNDDTGMTFYDEGATTPTSDKDELIYRLQMFAERYSAELEKRNPGGMAKELDRIIAYFAQSNESAIENAMVAYHAELLKDYEVDVQARVRLALEGLLEHSEVYPEKGIGSINPVRAVPVSAIQNELKDIWFTDDLPSTLENLAAAANGGSAPTLKGGDASS